MASEMSDARQELEPEVRQALESLREVEPPDEGRRGAQRAIFIEQARRHASAAAADRQMSRSSRPGKLFPTELLARRKWALAGAMLAVVLVLFAGSGGVIYAANGAVPGEPLYALDQAVETTRLRLTSRPEAVVGLLLTLAQERLEEAQALLEEGDLENLGTALEGYGSTVSSLAVSLAETEDDQVPELAALVDSSFSGDVGQEPASAPVLGAETAQGLDDQDYCADTGSHPVAAALAETYEVDYDQIMDWFCVDHFGLGEIMLALETWDKIEDGATTDGAAYADVGALLASRSELGWGQVWQGLGLIGKGRASVGPPSAFPVGPSEVAEVPEDAPAEPVRSGAEMDETGEWCVGADPHPVAEGLAESYGVDYDEVMGWFCDGYGLGEIKLALETAGQSDGDYTWDQLLVLKTEMGGWGEVWQSLGLIGRGNGDEDDEDEPEEGEGSLDDGAGYYCDEAALRKHPVAFRLSEVYSDTLGVPYATIMDWFCNDHRGLGEIKLALDASESLSEQGLPEACAGTDAEGLTECLWALRSTKGWGQVWHELGFLGKPSKDKSLAPDDDVTLDTQGDRKVPPGQDKEKKPKPQKPPKPAKPAKPVKPVKPEKPPKPAKPEKPAKPLKG